MNNPYRKLMEQQHLSDQAKQAFYSYLQHCASKFGQTLIDATHNPEITEKADKVIYPENGRIIESNR